MKGNFTFKSIPMWLLSFLFINILYLFFKDVVFYGVFIVLYSFIIGMKIKNKAPFIMLELIIFIINIIILIICAINSDETVLKLIVMNLETWFLVYLFSEKSIK